MKYIAAFIVVTTAMAFAQEVPRAPLAPIPPMPPDRRGLAREDYRGDLYRRGQSALDHRDYNRAIEAFDRVIADKGSRADGALYWRAYAENKLGKRPEALATLAELKKDYPASRWLEEAQALEVEVRQASGSPISPENASDEDTKILILSGMADSDPERTVPILEKVLKGNNSPKVKERALFVLAQSHSPKSRDLIGQIAKGRYNPDLQAKAVEYLGIFGGPESAQTLSEVYKSTPDLQVKKSILRGFMVSGNKDAVLGIAKSDSNPALRVEAIHLLGAMGGASVGDSLSALYAKETDPAIKREILNALFIHQNAHALIEIARKETDPRLKQEAIRKLSIMHNKEATDYLMEILNK